MSEIIRTLEGAISLAKEWRLEEFALIKKFISEMDDEGKVSKKDTLILKMCLVVIYAHAEGYVKQVLDAYLKALKTLELKYSDIHTNFLVLSIGDRFKKSENQENFEKRIQFSDIFINVLNNNFPFPEQKLQVDTKSNLNTKVLKELCFQYALDGYRFSGLYDDLDRLVDTRNKIAHGENNLTDRQQVIKYLTVVEDLMDELEKEILDVMDQKKYLKNNKTNSPLS